MIHRPPPTKRHRPDPRRLMKDLPSKDNNIVSVVPTVDESRNDDSYDSPIPMIPQHMQRVTSINTRTTKPAYNERKPNTFNNRPNVKQLARNNLNNNNSPRKNHKGTIDARKPNAGVLPIELLCDNGAGRCGHAFILLQTRDNYKPAVDPNASEPLSFSDNRPFTDGGGRADPNDLTPAHTAAREMREESANLIAFTPEQLAPSLALDLDGKYICYVVITDPINIAEFAKNKQIVSDQGAPPEWLETASMAKFYLADLTTRTRTDTAFDIYGVEHLLSSRISRLLKKFIGMSKCTAKNVNIVSLSRTTSTASDYTASTTTYCASTNSAA